MNINTEIRLLRLNYEWSQLINIIKTYDAELWSTLFSSIQDGLGDLLGDVQVSIASDHSIFDDCIRQAPDLYNELMITYESIILNYRNVLGMYTMLSSNDISTLLQQNANNHIFAEINILFHYINNEIASESYMDNSGIFVDGVRYYNFKLTKYNVQLLDAMHIDMQNVNSERFLEDIRLYIDAFITYEVIYSQ